MSARWCALRAGTPSERPMAESVRLHRLRSCVVATYDQPSGAMRLYENGMLTSENLYNSTLTPVVPLDPAYHPGVGIGTNNSFPDSSVNYGFNGAIDDVRIYNRALTASEVQALYRQGLVGQ